MVTAKVGWMSEICLRLLALLVFPFALAACAEEAPKPLTEAACAAGGGNSVGVAGASNNRLGDPKEDLGKADACPGGRHVLGFLSPVGDSNGALCCQIPPDISIATCEGLGGYSLGDRGNGSGYIEGCPGGAALLGWITSCDQPGLCGEGGICCGK